MTVRGRDPDEIVTPDVRSVTSNGFTTVGSAGGSPT
jgi:hypothetical protein